MVCIGLAASRSARLVGLLVVAVGIGASASPTAAQTLTIGTAGGLPGASVWFNVSFDPQGISVASTLNTISFSSSTPVTDCVAGDAPGKVISFTFLPGGCDGTAVPCTSVRAMVWDGTDPGNPPTAILVPVVLYRCRVDIPASAAYGTYPLTADMLSAADPPGNAEALAAVNGYVAVVPPNSGGSCALSPIAAERSTALPYGLGVLMLLAARRVVSRWRHRCSSRVVWVLVGCLAWPTMASATCGGDCDGSGMVTVDEVLTAVNIALQGQGLDICPAADGNNDLVVTIDEILGAVNHALQGCPGSPTPTPQPTDQVTHTPTRTPTRVNTATPASSPANLIIHVTNTTGSDRTVCLFGMMVGGSPRSMDSHYGCPPTGCSVSNPGTPVCTPIPNNCSGASCEVSIGNLAPGEWMHGIMVPTPSANPTPACLHPPSRQTEYTRTVLVADPNAPNQVNWKVYRTVFSVNTPVDATTSNDCISSGACVECRDGTLPCRFRCAIKNASTDTLIQLSQAFSPQLFERSDLADSRIYMNAARLTIDGTQADGKSRTTISQNGSSSGAVTLVFNNDGGQLIGASLSRVLPADAELTNDDTDGVRFGTGSKNCVVRSCLIDGGAQTRTAADDSGPTPIPGSPTPTPIPAVGKDCVDTGDGTATTSFADANVIENSELRYCYDRAVKSQFGYLIVRDSSVHQNLRGGLFAMFPNGHIRAERNVIEQNGKNAAGATTRADAAQIAAQRLGTTPTPNPTPAEVVTDGNIIRNGTNRGIFLDDRSVATIANDYVCGMSGNGISTTGAAGSIGCPSPPCVTVRRTTVVYNTSHGATLGGSSLGDFGTTADFGDNAFTRNGLNFDDSSTQTTVPVVQNQWEHCGGAPACDDTAIKTNDIHSDNSGAPFPLFQISQPQRNPQSFVIDSVLPTKVAGLGALVHIRGAGFNAIDGHPAGGDCATTLANNNICGPAPDYVPSGTCVQFELSPNSGVWKNAQVQSVTPTEVVVKWPAVTGCALPIRVRIRHTRALEGGATIVEDAVGPTGQPFTTYCTN